MIVTSFDSLICPLDNHPLQRAGASWRCASGHTFDIAREGYIHLLPVQNKRSRDPGDSKEMVAARRRFLGAGCYQPIAAAVSRAVLGETTRDPLTDVPPGADLSCLDAGCGEGYYLRELAAACGDVDSIANSSLSTSSLSLIGLDISKWAVLSAAKQDKRMCWVVGSNANLPVESRSLDRVLCMFGFPVYAEFLRVLKPGGLLLQVDSGPDHLRELREIIYPTLKAERTEEVPVPDGFERGSGERQSTETVRFSLDLHGQEQIADLLAMTPHLYRATAEGRARAAALTSLVVTVDVRLTTLRVRA
ncbi:MAG: methyltransferase domain-containing protein [Gammaproteobacteria bacterium]|nr:methyltransferase domain-containing protein [Gammaproteobacteria bacterium]